MSIYRKQMFHCKEDTKFIRQMTIKRLVHFIQDKHYMNDLQNPFDY